MHGTQLIFLSEASVLFTKMYFDKKNLIIYNFKNVTVISTFYVTHDVIYICDDVA